MLHATLKSLCRALQKAIQGCTQPFDAISSGALGGSARCFGEVWAAEKAIKKYVLLAKKHKILPSTFANAFVNSRPFVTSNIIGATNLSQLRENIESINIKLSKEILEKSASLLKLVLSIGMAPYPQPAITRLKTLS